MKKYAKGLLGMGILSAIAIGIAIPIYKKVDVNDLKINGQYTSIVNAAENIDLTSGDDTNTEAASVSEGESEYKYMEKFSETFNPTYKWSEAMNSFYTTKPEDYEDENLRSLAEEYTNKGYYLTDKAFIKHTTGEGFGFGDYCFVVGFEVVDAKDGNNTFSIDVIKATQEEFNLLIEDYFEPDEKYEKKEDGNIIEIDYGNYKLIYDSEKEILIYHADLSGEGVG